MHHSLLNKVFIVPLISVCLAATAFGADLRITDSTNTTVLVRDAVIEYGGFSKDNETEGIRLRIGDGLVTAKWANVDRITLGATDRANPTADISVEILLTNGQRMNGTLLRKGRMKLTGQADVGAYSIDLESIRSIVSLRKDRTN